VETAGSKSRPTGAVEIRNRAIEVRPNVGRARPAESYAGNFSAGGKSEIVSVATVFLTWEPARAREGAGLRLNRGTTAPAGNGAATNRLANTICNDVT